MSRNSARFCKDEQIKFSFAAFHLWFQDPHHITTTAPHHNNNSTSQQDYITTTITLHLQQHYITKIAPHHNNAINNNQTTLHHNNYNNTTSQQQDNITTTILHHYNDYNLTPTTDLSSNYTRSTKRYSVAAAAVILCWLFAQVWKKSFVKRGNKRLEREWVSERVRANGLHFRVKLVKRYKEE